MEYGLVCTGGGARGAYHAGVYKALTKMNMTVSAVTGTSIGAVTGALIAAGETENIIRLWHTITLEKLTGKKHPLCRCDTDCIKKLLDEIINEDKIRRSDILFGFEVFSARDKRNHELFISDVPYGKLTQYLTASVCMPIFKAVKIDGEKYIDGGMIDNAPVDMLINKGFNNIIISDDHGIGHERSMKQYKENIIRIRCKNPFGGILNFDKSVTRCAISQGYFDCLHEFGAVSGDIYAFENNSYCNYIKQYGKSTLKHLEEKAQKLGIDPYRQYSAESFVLYTSSKLTP